MSSATSQIGIGKATSGCDVRTSIDWRMPSVPVSTKIAMIPSAKPTSPTRFVMNAFLLASAAERLRYQKPISR